MDLNEVNYLTRAELNHIIQRYNYDSVREFLIEYASAEIKIPGTDFVALPFGRGMRLYNFVRETNADKARMDAL